MPAITMRAFKPCPIEAHRRCASEWNLHPLWTCRLKVWDPAAAGRQPRPRPAATRPKSASMRFQSRPFTEPLHTRFAWRQITTVRPRLLKQADLSCDKSIFMLILPDRRSSGWLARQQICRGQMCAGENHQRCPRRMTRTSRKINKIQFVSSI